MISARTLNDMLPVLKNPSAPGPEEIYYVIRGKPNITILNPGKIGDEFVKTYGHYHKHNEPEQYEVLLGQAIFILQDKKSAWAIKAKKGDRIDIPAGCGHAMANISEIFLITIDNAALSAEHSQNDYKSVEEKHGLGIYVIEKNKKIVLEKNPYYNVDLKVNLSI